MTSLSKQKLSRPMWLNIFALINIVLFGIAMYLGLVRSPVDVTQGDLIRIMYAHVSVAWICFLAVFLCAIFGSLFLWRSGKLNDVLAVASAEMAMFFAALTLIGGMTYSKPTLNTWWTWDAKLTATALLFFMLVGYFIVRGLIDDPVRRGRVSAVIGLIILADVPIIYFASEWWRTLHPAKSLNLDGSGVTMQPEFVQVLLFNVAVAALIYIYFMVERVRIGRLEAGQEEWLEQNQQQKQTSEAIHV